MTERQEQALRGLLRCTWDREEREREHPGYILPYESRFFTAGQVAWGVDDELPESRQLGNGAKDGRSWSGVVPKARFMGVPLRTLAQGPLVQRLDYRDRRDARSDAYRLTPEGREEAERLARERARE